MGSEHPFGVVDAQDFHCGRCGTLLDGGTDEPVAARAWREVAQELAEALRDHLSGGCREWVTEKHNRCGAPAECVLWGKLIPPDGLGPRCYDHAIRYVGDRAIGDPSWAVIDFGPAARALARFDGLNTEERDA